MRLRSSSLGRLHPEREQGLILASLVGSARPVEQGTHDTSFRPACGASVPPRRRQCAWRRLGLREGTRWKTPPSSRSMGSRAAPIRAAWRRRSSPVSVSCGRGPDSVTAETSERIDDRRQRLGDRGHRNGGGRRLDRLVPRGDRSHLSAAALGSSAAAEGPGAPEERRAGCRTRREREQWLAARRGIAVAPPSAAR